MFQKQGLTKKIIGSRVIHLPLVAKAGCNRGKSKKIFIVMVFGRFQQVPHALNLDIHHQLKRPELFFGNKLTHFHAGCVEDAVNASTGINRFFNGFKIRNIHTFVIHLNSQGLQVFNVINGLSHPGQPVQSPLILNRFHPWHLGSKQCHEFRLGGGLHQIFRVGGIDIIDIQNDLIDLIGLNHLF
jgi:hypothetical protein